ncbi:MAG: nuclear transport factor 2 family protein [Thermoleophilia bacterium]
MTDDAVAARIEIVDAVTRLFWLTDHHRWDELPAVLADRVRLDYTSLQGGAPVTLASADVVDAWRGTLGALDAHQHLVGNHLVDVRDDGTAIVTAAFQATHQFRGDTWTLGGDYRFELAASEGRWRIAAMTMTAVWQTGDARLIARAARPAR